MASLKPVSEFPMDLACAVAGADGFRVCGFGVCFFLGVGVWGVGLGLRVYGCERLVSRITVYGLFSIGF